MFQLLERSSTLVLQLSLTTAPPAFHKIWPMPTRIKTRNGRARPRGSPNFIRAWREFRRLSQDRLVAKVRERVTTFSKSTLSRLETGGQDYRQPVLEALAWALECTPADLLERSPTDTRGLLIGSLKRIPDSELAALARVIRAFDDNGSRS
jgi:transcriptional regulator with XRE-family HTH domain